MTNQPSRNLFLAHDEEFLEATSHLSRRTLLVLAAAGAATLAALADGALVAPVARAAGWGGHANGRIPASALSPVPARLGPRLRSDAAVAYLDLSTAFHQRFGSSLSISEGYRDFARQQYLYEGWTNHRPGFALAAPPGTSVHGWALACDFGSGVERYGSPQKIWMDANAPRFGWSPRGNTFAWREAWHFEFTGSYSPPPTLPEDDMPYSEAQLKLIIRDAMIGILRAPEFNADALATRVWSYKTADMPGRAWEALRDTRQIARRAEIEAQKANAQLAKISAALKVPQV
ncbi:D-alanyl-D-alanine carboxypeptidase [Frondihabitans sp. 762G35]|uniref:M15 family metallopeptidase n=1 Tax=Frondihabitans sp. 762G35 TaxID=1446794 RepID=UPI000D21D103|nr:M15 family metallopeptidase [Frondihabitans sp. 762G35]ARC56725.1 D-alanyl-D-alanine carboxypeptidase [Frondihabitans sp. 762G35]